MSLYQTRPHFAVSSALHRSHFAAGCCSWMSHPHSAPTHNLHPARRSLCTRPNGDISHERKCSPDIAVAAAVPPIPISDGGIPLSPEYLEYLQKRSWRLPVKTEVFIAMLMNRLKPGAAGSEEISCACEISTVLSVQSLGYIVSKPPPSGCGGSGGGEADAPKRKLRSSVRKEPPKRGRGQLRRGRRDGLCNSGILESKSVETCEPELSDESGEQRSDRSRTFLTIPTNNSSTKNPSCIWSPPRGLGSCFIILVYHRR
jgi:hypothetical protein